MKTVCIVEDNASIRKLYSTVFKKSGLDVVDFPDASSVINWLKSNNPDLFIIDILLPDINGVDLVATIKKISGMEKIPAIAITGFSTSKDEDKFISAGFDKYFSKPVNITSLVEEIKKILL